MTGDEEAFQPLRLAVDALLQRARAALTFSTAPEDIKRACDELREMLRIWTSLDDHVGSSVRGLLQLMRKNCKHPRRRARIQRARRELDESLSDLRGEPVRRPTTKIRVLGETWRVPRGFGAVYRRVLKDHFAEVAAGNPGKIISAVIDLLTLVGYHATADQVTDWDLRRRVEAVVYAATEYARASDNPVQRYPRPSWLPRDPWKGPPADVSACRNAWQIALDETGHLLEYRKAKEHLAVARKYAKTNRAYPPPLALNEAVEALVAVERKLFAFAMKWIAGGTP